jgi:predicted TIM-barrel fold metal-dependent hydrolase
MNSRRGFLRLTAATVGSFAARNIWAQSDETETPIVDMHVHLIRKMFSSAENPLVSHWTWHEYNGDLLVQEMNVAGVDKALLKTFNREDVAYPLKTEFGAEPHHFESSEGYMLEYRDKYPDRFIWAATVNPLIENFQDQWIGKFARGLQGIVLFPGLQDHSLKHENITWLLEQCDKRNIKGIMMSFENVDRTHTSEDYIKQLYEMIDSFPNLHYDFIHTGYQVRHMLDREPTLKLINHFNEKYGNVWAQADNFYLDSKYPFPKFLEGVKDLFDNIGPDRVFWGTDWPWVDNIGKYYQFVQTLRENCTYMTAAQLGKVLGPNALDFLALAKAS